MPIQTEAKNIEIKGIPGYASMSFKKLTVKQKAELDEMEEELKFLESQMCGDGMLCPNLPADTKERYMALIEEFETYGN